MNIINSSDIAGITPFFQRLHFPSPNSHKGQNGKLLVVGGSSLFHSASLWACEIASHFTDMVHYCSTPENAKVMLSLKKKFHNGIVIHQKELLNYVKEDDVVLLGPGMLRGKKTSVLNASDFSTILKLQETNEASFTAGLSHFLFTNFSSKKFVLDAGVLQMMDKEWLCKLKIKPILTPHVKEFSHLFGLHFESANINTYLPIIVSIAKQYKCVLIVKYIDDIITDGKQVAVVRGGNQGLTKGGTGDILSGLIAALYTCSDPFISAVVSSFVLKTTADSLYGIKGTWYNNDDIIDMIPRVFNQIRKNDV